MLPTRLRTRLRLLEQPMRSPKLGLGCTEEIWDSLPLITAPKLSRAFPSPQKMQICASPCSLSGVSVSLVSQLLPAEINLSELNIFYVYFFSPFPPSLSQFQVCGQNADQQMRGDEGLAGK